MRTLTVYRVSLNDANAKDTTDTYSPDKLSGISEVDYLIDVLKLDKLILNSSYCMPPKTVDWITPPVLYEASNGSEVDEVTYCLYWDGYTENFRFGRLMNAAIGTVDEMLKGVCSRECSVRRIARPNIKFVHTVSPDAPITEKDLKELKKVTGLNSFDELPPLTEEVVNKFRLFVEQ